MDGEQNPEGEVPKRQVIQPITGDIPSSTSSMTDSTDSQLAQLLGKLLCKKPIPKLPNFAGRDATKREAKYEDWRYLVNNLAERKDDYGLSQSELIDTVVGSLTGEARTRFIRLDCNRSNVKEILCALDLVYADQTTPMDRLRILQSTVQKKDESVSSFADRMEEVAFNLERNAGSMKFDRDSLLKTVFMAGIFNERIRDRLEHMRDDDSKSYERVRSRAILLETELVKETVHEKRSSVKPVQSETDQKLATLLDLVQNLQKKVEQTEEKRRTENRPRFNPRPNNPQNCFYCGESGHFMRSCPHRNKDLNK